VAKTRIVFYRDEKGVVPILKWLDELPFKARIKSIEKIERLREKGHELRRPEADYLRDEIYELRASFQSVHYRILYFFNGKALAVISHGLIKEKAVPPREIDRAIEQKNKFRANPKLHSHEEIGK